MDERQRCGSFRLWHEHLYDDFLQVGCLILSAAAIIVAIGSAITTLGALAPAVPTVAMAAGAFCLADALDEFFFSSGPASVIYQQGDDRWLIETGTPSHRVFIPDGPSTIQVYGT